MSLIKEINELHIGMQYFVLSLCLIAPFFYIDIYFLKNSFFISAPPYITIVATVCMSISWYISNAISMMLSPLVMVLNIKSHGNFTQFFVLAVSVLLLLFVSVLCMYFKIKFRTFFHILAGITILRFLGVFFLIKIFGESIQMGKDKTSN